MTVRLRFGLDQALELDLPPGAVLVECAATGRAADPTAETAAALAEPLDFPPLRQATVPGDRVALALAAGVPQADSIVAAVVECLIAGGVQPADITVVRTAADAAGGTDPLAKLPAAMRGQVAVHVHDPTDRNVLALLGYTKAGRAVYLSRPLCDADLAVPVGLVRPGAHAPADSDAVGDCLYPAFSDDKTLARFHSADAGDAAATGHTRTAGEAHEAGWLLGAQFTVQVVPGPDGQALHVLAGQGAAVHQRGGELAIAAWRTIVPARASLVVAAISGDATQQTWDNLGRALETAGRLVAEGGAIAVCCEINSPPGPAVECLTRDEDRLTTVRRLRREAPADLHIAAQIAQALEGGHVYLLSRLEDGLIEDLGMTPVADTAELARLVRRSATCILLSDAQHSQAEVAE